MKREDAERLGIVTATQEGAEEMLRGKYEMIGSYPDLVAQAQMNRPPRRGELVIGRVLFQFPSNSKKTQIPVGKSKMMLYRLPLALVTKLHKRK